MLAIFHKNVLKPNSHNPIWDDTRTWEFRKTRGNTNVSLSQNSRMETKREYVSDVDTDTDSDADVDYKAKKCAFRTWKYRCAPADVMEKCEHRWGTVICRYMTVWILQIASSQKMVMVHRRIFRRRMFRRHCFGSQDRTCITRSNIENDENLGKGEHEEWINQKLHSPWICTNHQHGWENSDR